MNYRRLGSSGLRVSEIALGNAQWKRDQSEEKRWDLVLDQAWDLGINLYDTADVYTQGDGEQILGSWLKGKPREQVVVATKCGSRAWDGPIGEGLSKKHILEAAEKSLRRLGTDYIDIYQFHWPDSKTPIEESLEAMDVLVRQGKVLYPGCSNYDTEELRDALEAADDLGLPRFVSHQPRYSMFHRTIEASLMSRCATEGIGIIVWSPLEQGLLSERYLSGEAPPGSRFHESDERSRWLNPTNLEAMRALADIAHSKGATLSQLALAWILAHPEITSCITSASRAEQVEENVQAADLDISDDDLRQIEEILAAREKSLACQ